MILDLNRSNPRPPTKFIVNESRNASSRDVYEGGLRDSSSDEHTRNESDIIYWPLFTTSGMLRNCINLANYNAELGATLARYSDIVDLDTGRRCFGAIRRVLLAALVQSRATADKGARSYSQRSADALQKIWQCKLRTRAGKSVRRFSAFRDALCQRVAHRALLMLDRCVIEQITLLIPAEEIRAVMKSAPEVLGA